MFYLLYQSLAQHNHHVPVLNLLRYLTFRTGLSVVTAQLVVAAMGSRFIAWMRAKQGRGQPIRKEGPESHIIEKAGTPTMGGFMILAGIMVGALLWSDLTNVYVWVVLLVTASYGLLGFLWYNAPPARIFMGDTGSLALGGALGAIAVAAKHEIVLAIVGGLFVLEACSVMIQIAYFKVSGGKRIFLMAPIHHHFEKLGWRESTVVIRFWIISVVLALIGLATLKIR